MLTRMLTAAGTLAIAAAALLLTPSAAYAKGHGGGGGHGNGSGHGNNGGHGNSGGYHNGGGFGIYLGGYPGSGWGYGGYYPGYYNGYSYGDNGYYNYPDYYNSGSGYQPQYNYSNMPPVYGAAPSANVVILDMRLPDPNAQVWIEDQPTQQHGTVREFESPPLTPGQTYTYHLRAQWMQNGRPVDQTRAVTVQAGSRANVDFSVVAPQPATTYGNTVPNTTEQVVPTSRTQERGTTTTPETGDRNFRGNNYPEPTNPAPSVPPRKGTDDRNPGK